MCIWELLRFHNCVLIFVLTINMELNTYESSLFSIFNLCIVLCCSMSQNSATHISHIFQILSQFGKFNCVPGNSSMCTWKLFNFLLFQFFQIQFVSVFTGFYATSELLCYLCWLNDQIFNFYRIQFYICRTRSYMHVKCLGIQFLQDSIFIYITRLYLQVK